MSEAHFDSIPLWILLAGTILLTSGALEAGYRAGKRRNALAPEEKDGSLGSTVGAILGLLAFMLAFTFGMAATRFDARRQAVLEEANAIKTAYLRAQLLPAPQRDATIRLLQDYVSLRLASVQSHTVAVQGVARSEQLHELLWAEAMSAAQANPSPITSLFLQSLKDLYDWHARRVMAGLRSRIPVGIWAGLLLLAVFGMASVGYLSGRSTSRRSPTLLVLLFSFASVLFLIADLDRGHEGLLKVSQQAIVDLQQSMPQHATDKQ